MTADNALSVRKLKVWQNNTWNYITSH